MANKKIKNRHLTLTDRTYIEQELVKGSTFTEIAKIIRSALFDKDTLDRRIPVLTGQFEISPDDVMLKPDLLSIKKPPAFAGG